MKTKNREEERFEHRINNLRIQQLKLAEYLTKKNKIKEKRYIEKMVKRWHGHENE